MYPFTSTHAVFFMGFRGIFKILALCDKLVTKSSRGLVPWICFFTRILLEKKQVLFPSALGEQGPLLLSALERVPQFLNPFPSASILGFSIVFRCFFQESLESVPWPPNRQGV